MNQCSSVLTDIYAKHNIAYTRMVIISPTSSEMSPSLKAV